MKLDMTQLDTTYLGVTVQERQAAVFDALKGVHATILTTDGHAIQGTIDGSEYTKEVPAPWYNGCLHNCVSIIVNKEWAFIPIDMIRKVIAR